MFGALRQSPSFLERDQIQHAPISRRSWWSVMEPKTRNSRFPEAQGLQSGSRMVDVAELGTLWTIPEMAVEPTRHRRLQTPIVRTRAGTLTRLPGIGAIVSLQQWIEKGSFRQV